MSEQKVEIEIPEADFTPLTTPGTKADEREQAEHDAAISDENTSLIDEPNENDAAAMARVSSLITMMFSSGFGLVASRRGEHWALKPEETVDLHESIDLFMRDAFPDSKISPGWAVLGTCGALILPRLGADAMLEHDSEGNNEPEK